MKLNNKGMTLMELLVSLTLISVVLVFMYKVLADLQYKKATNDLSADNMIKITEIENKVQKDLLGKSISKITITATKLTYDFDDASSIILKYDPSPIEYNSEKWNLKGLTVGTPCYKTDSAKKGIIIKIPLNNNGKTISIIGLSSGPYTNLSESVDECD